MKWPAVSVKEAAEHLIKLQTQNLNPHQQAFQTHHKYIADDSNQDITNAAGHFCQGKYHEDVYKRQL